MKNFVLLFFAALYLLFYNRFPTGDAWAYAGNIRWGDFLFYPHHLLYNGFGFLLKNIVELFGYEIDEMRMMQSVNALFATGILFIFMKILERLKVDEKNIPALLLFAGSCFGFWRFATENETYIIPVLFSLSASYYFIRYIGNGRKFHLFSSSLLGVIAILFHQIHIFWWLALLTGSFLYRKNVKVFILYALPTFLLPFVYYFAASDYYGETIGFQEFVSFVLGEYATGKVQAEFGLKNILFGIISFIRSFIQVHGLQLFLIKKSYVWLLPLLLSLVFLLLSLRKFMKLKPLKRADFQPNNFIAKIHWLAFILQLLFAIFSVGNVEFMTMLPLLLMISLSARYNISSKFLFPLGLSLFVWNFSFLAVPQVFLKLKTDKELATKVMRQPSAYFILPEPQLINNIIYYQTGAELAENVLYAPNMLRFQGKDPQLLFEVINEQHRKRRKVFLYEPVNLKFTRAQIITDADNFNFLSSAYTLEPVLSMPSFFGENKIYELKQKASENRFSPQMK